MIFSILLYIILLWTCSCLSKKFAGCLEKKKNNDTKRLSVIFKGDKKKKKIFFESYNKQLIIKIKREYFKWMPYWVGILEWLFFSLITIFIFDFSFILKCFAGWMAIKCIGGYASWSDAIFGRINFYTFLLCTIFNIVLALLAGLVLRELIIIDIKNYYLLFLFFC